MSDRATRMKRLQSASPAAGILPAGAWSLPQEKPLSKTRRILSVTIIEMTGANLATGDFIKADNAGGNLEIVSLFYVGVGAQASQPADGVGDIENPLAVLTGVQSVFTVRNTGPGTIGIVVRFVDEDG